MKQKVYWHVMSEGASGVAEFLNNLVGYKEKIDEQLFRISSVQHFQIVYIQKEDVYYVFALCNLVR